MVCVDGQGSIVLVNDQAERLFGYPREELVGSSIDVLVPESKRAAHAAHRERYLSAPVARAMGAALDLAARHQDGRRLPVEISLSTINVEDGVLTAAVIRDVTQRRQAAIVASSSNAIVSRTLDGVVTAGTPPAERIYGRSAAER